MLFASAEVAASKRDGDAYDCLGASKDDKIAVTGIKRLAFRPDGHLTRLARALERVLTRELRLEFRSYVDRLGERPGDGWSAARA